MWRIGDERGQATSEYAALVALVAVALALAAGLTSGGLAGHVLAGLQRGLCVVAGGSCPRPLTPRADLAPCPLERTIRSESLNGALALVRLGRRGMLTTVRGSDGRVSVTLADERTDGIEAGLGLSVRLGAARGAEASAGLSFVFTSGSSWTMPNAAAARAFVERYGSKATIGGKAVDFVRGRCSLLCDAVGWRPHAQLPPPDERFWSDGAAARFEASLGSQSLHASGGRLLGLRVQRDGATTVFMRLDDAIGAQLGSGAVALRTGEQRAVAVSYVTDAHRRPTSLVVHTVTRGEERASLQGSHGRANAGAGAGSGLLTELDATLDLRDERSRAAADAFVAALRNPLSGELKAHAAALREQIARAGIVDRRRYALKTSSFSLGAEAALGRKLGGSFERTSEAMRLLSAETRLPGLPFLPRDDCRPA